MRRRLALQSTSCEMLRKMIPFRESFGSANASPRRFYFSHCCLSPRSQCRAQMPNFVFYIARIFDGLGDFLANEPAITTPQIVKLFLNRRLCYRQGTSQSLIRNVCALRGKRSEERRV